MCRVQKVKFLIARDGIQELNWSEWTGPGATTQ
jgi:hypothetical protein